MAEDIFTYLKGQIDTQVTRFSEALTSGANVSTFSDYQRLVGQIDGLKDARRLIDGVERRYLNDDEDEDEDRPEG
jgi:hypothetical protein